MSVTLTLPNPTITVIQNNSPAKPALWNDRYAEIDENFDALKTAVDTIGKYASTTERGIIQLATAAEVLAGTDAEKAVTPKELADWINGVIFKAFVPIGAVLHYLGTTVPSGYLLCNGASLSRTEYPELFSVIGTACGSDSASTFKIPDMHHRFLEGTTVLSEVGAYIAAGLPNSTGQVYEVQFGTATNALGIFQIVSSWNNNISGGSDIYTEKMSSIGIDMSLSNTIYGKSSTVQPSALRSLCLIRSY